MKANVLAIIALAVIGNWAHAQKLALVKEDRLIGYIDPSGQYAIPPKFEKANSFSGKYASVAEGKKWGFINTKGDWAIAPEYDKVNDFNSGLALVAKGEDWFYIREDNTPLEIVEKPDKFYSFDQGVAFFKRGEKIGLLGTDGKFVAEPDYDVIKPFASGYAKASKNGLWGLIDTKGNILVPIEYEEISGFSPTGLWARNGAAFGLIIDGKFTPIDGVDKIYDFQPGSELTYARKGGKIGFIDNRGNWKIEPGFDKARAFNKGLAPVALGKGWGYINPQGKLVVDYIYKDAEIMADNGLAPVKEKEWGFIDQQGKVVIPMEYGISSSFSFLDGDAVKGFDGDLARVKSKKGWGFLDPKGNLLNNTWYKNVELFVDTGK